LVRDEPRLEPDGAVKHITVLSGIHLQFQPATPANVEVDCQRSLPAPQNAAVEQDGCRCLQITAANPDHHAPALPCGVVKSNGCLQAVAGLPIRQRRQLVSQTGSSVETKTCEASMASDSQRISSERGSKGQWPLPAEARGLLKNGRLKPRKWCCMRPDGNQSNNCPGGTRDGRSERRVGSSQMQHGSPSSRLQVCGRDAGAILQSDEHGCLPHQPPGRRRAIDEALPGDRANALDALSGNGDGCCV
jgi:hypothetical protein